MDLLTAYKPAAADAVARWTGDDNCEHCGEPVGFRLGSVQPCANCNGLTEQGEA